MTAPAADTIRVRTPREADAIAVWRLVGACPPLDLNTPYCYLLLCSHLRDTCVVAETSDDGIVGFLAAITTATHPESLFVWQVAVASAVRRRGVAGRLLRAVLAHPAAASCRFVEATVGPDNGASRALFRRLADERAIPLQISAGFGRDRFPDATHGREDWLRIGPLR